MKFNHYIFPNWPAPKNVKAASTTRTEGHSTAPYDSFNLGFGTEDNPENVKKNRQQLRDELQLPSEPIWLHQIHSNHVIQASKNLNRPEADATYTTEPKLVCVVMTADCMPVLICNHQGTKVAAVHAGWRGLAAGIIEATLKAMKISSEDALVWLGPAIGSHAFEVGEDVVQQFLQIDFKAQLAFQPKDNKKWLGDLYLLAKQRLAKQGIAQVYGEGFCTFTDQQRFFSHRRDKGITGRMATLIWLEK